MDYITSLTNLYTASLYFLTSKYRITDFIVRPIYSQTSEFIRVVLGSFSFREVPLKANVPLSLSSNVRIIFMLLHETQGCVCETCI
jgi:hypothetical protein